jgi:hypothetical protein
LTAVSGWSRGSRPSSASLSSSWASCSAYRSGRILFSPSASYILTSNIPELVPYLAFVVFKIPLPLTIIQILAVDLGSLQCSIFRQSCRASGQRLSPRCVTISVAQKKSIGTQLPKTDALQQVQESLINPLTGKESK